MEKLDSFTIRVYGVLVNNGKLLRLKEPFWGEVLYKLPGGGLEFGEGTVACLKRELKEELNLNLVSATHFYTQEDFIRSKFKTNEQLLTIYYKITCDNLDKIVVHEPNIEELSWVSLEQLSEEDMSLPVDKIVVRKLLSELE